MSKNESQVILAAVVDRLAAIKATIATLQEEEAALRAALVDSGQAVIMGTTHRATVSEVAGRAVTDWRAVAEHFTPSRQLVTAHTSTTEPHTAVRLSAHKTK